METLKLGKFMRGLYWKNKKRRNPLRAMAELTYRCNLKCVHCYNPENKGRKELSKEEWFSVISQLADIGVLHIAFTGGEIFARPDAMDIIFYAKKKGLQVALMTNGTFLTEEIADKLISWGVSKFEISFLGATKETFDKVTQVKGSFERVLSVVKMLRRKGVIPQIKTCVLNINLDEVERIADLAKKLGASFSYSPLVIPKLDLQQEPGRFRIGPEDFLNIRKRFARFYNKPDNPKKLNERKKTDESKEKPGFWERGRLFWCMAGNNMAFISPYGEIKSCMTVPEPNYDIKDGRVRQGWENIKKFTGALKAPVDWKCYTCEYNAWCSWCPGRGYLNTGDIFGCPPYFKELAKARKEKYEKAKGS